MWNKKIIIFFSIFLVLLNSCDTDVEIVIPENFEEENPISQFKVDFNGETWNADAVFATIISGTINITALRNDNQEKVIITILSDQIGTYTISPDDFVGGMAYQDDNDGNSAFVSNPGELSGVIDLESIDVDRQLLSGKFFFTGTRFIPQLDDEGNPVLDENDNPILIEESKDFTNGEFINIIYTSEIADPDPTNDNEFFANFNGIEFVEESLVAIKSTLAGISTISISANRDGINETIGFTMPADIVTGNYLLTDFAVDLTEDTVGTYINNVTSQFYGAGSGEDDDDVTIPILRISNHDVDNKLIEGTFEFTGFEVGSQDPTKVQITEGSFSITYIN